MRLMWMQAFRAVMKTGSVSGAEDIVLRTQPQISRMISSLEKSLDLKLFDRIGRRLVPTEHALEYLRYIEPMLQTLDQMPAAAEDIRAKRSRPIVLSVEPFLVHALVPHAAEHLLTSNDVRMAFDYCIRGLGLWTSNKVADIGIVALPFAQTDMVQMPFAQARVVAVLPADHPLASNSLINFTDLKKERIIALRPTTLLRSQIDTLAAAAGVSFQPEIEVSSGVMACELVSRGMGITFGDPIVAQSFEDRGVVIKPLSEKIELTYGFLLPEKKLSNKLLKTVLGVVASSAKTLGGSFVELHPDWLRIMEE